MDRAVRVSDAERDRALDRLREAMATGRLSDSTFIRRVDITLRARTRAELRSVLDDLPSIGSSVRTMLTRMLPLPRARFAEPEDTGDTGDTGDTLPVLRLPRRADTPIRVGRGLGCGLRIGDATVSRTHAELENTAPGRWLVRDLDSSNGTFVNGIRITGAAEIAEADLIAFGQAVYRLRLGR